MSKDFARKFVGRGTRDITTKVIDHKEVEKDETDATYKELVKSVNRRINDLDENDPEFDKKLKRLEARRKALEDLVYGSK